MDKTQIISFIETQLSSGKITKADLDAIGGTKDGQKVEAPQATHSLTNTFYSIGATIAIIGIGILIGQHWQEIGFGGRLLVTLGIALATYIAALMLRSPEQHKLSQVLFMISAAIAPVGVFVLLDEANINPELSVQIGISLCLFAIYGVALAISRKIIVALITIGYGTWAYFATVLYMLDMSGMNAQDDILKWATMLIGVVYILLAYWYGGMAERTAVSERWEKEGLQNVLNGVGTLAILGAGIFVGDIFDLVYIALIFAAFYGSVYLKSRAMLSIASVFLMAHIIKLTSKYFVDSIGWPVALIIVGFLIIGVGYFTVYLSRKYIGKK